ncbi:hypothetical protein [Sphingomonas sp. LT1P40]|uniref:hypothetical protein n=1 Tax=Alteristakelama amylovorans TaxID=3096166 RepID=UPI002FC87A8F
MRRRTGIIVGFAALYAVVAALCLGPLFATGGLSDRTFGIAMVTGIALIPITAIILNMILQLKLRVRRSRPAAAKSEPQVSPNRERFEFAFAAWNGIDSAQAVTRLSARLTALGMAHDYDGEITVQDGDVRWQVWPVAGVLRIAGWVEAADADTRAMIRAAIEEFLIDELGIRLEDLAA